MSVAAVGHGGKRKGAGRKPTSLAEQARKLDFGDDPHAVMAELIGVSPRMAAARPDLAERFEAVPPGEHFDRFMQTFCRYNQLGEVDADGPKLGDPVALEAHEREFFDEALECDSRGRRVYRRTGMIIARKNRKTTLVGGLSLYFASPADGEPRPLVVQAAGVKDQAAKLYETTRAFIDDPVYPSAILRKLFIPSAAKIVAPSIAGEIRRVAGDGDNNHSLDPHAVAMDELHTWKTPKQRENFRALTTAGGGRLDPYVVWITTEGAGDDNELALLMERIEGDPSVEVEERRPGLTIFRSRDSGLLVFRYMAPESVVDEKTGERRRITIQDVEAIKLANPAPWRTVERLRQDLADPMNDPATKLRLYGNRRASAKDRWISDEAWRTCVAPLVIPKGAIVACGVDAARTRDTTALCWGWQDPKSRRIVLRWRVWSTEEGRHAHVYVPGGRLDNDLVRDYISDVIGDDLGLLPRLLFFDERYFDTQANDLSKDGMTVVEMHQGKPEMIAAWDSLYAAVYAGLSPTIAIDDDAVVQHHVRNALGLKTERGWKVSKIGSNVIDALSAGSMARYACEHFADFKRPRSRIVSW